MSNKIEFDNQRSKFASKGPQIFLSVYKLVNYLNSDIFLIILNAASDINIPILWGGMR